MTGGRQGSGLIISMIRYLCSKLSLALGVVHQQAPLWHAGYTMVAHWQDTHNGSRWSGPHGSWGVWFSNASRSTGVVQATRLFLKVRGEYRWAGMILAFLQGLLSSSHKSSWESWMDLLRFVFELSLPDLSRHLWLLRRALPDNREFLTEPGECSSWCRTRGLRKTSLGVVLAASLRVQETLSFRSLVLRTF